MPDVPVKEQRGVQKPPEIHSSYPLNELWDVLFYFSTTLSLTSKEGWLTKNSEHKEGYIMKFNDVCYFFFLLIWRDGH